MVRPLNHGAERVYYSYQMLLFIHYKHTVDLVRMKDMLYLRNLCFRRYHLRSARHDIPHGKLEELILRTLHGTTYVTIGDDAHNLIVYHSHAESESAVADMYHRLAKLHVRRDDRQIVRTHHVLCPGKQSLAERSSRMILGEVGSLEVACHHQRTGKGIAKGECCRGGRRRSKSERASLTADTGIEMCRSELGKQRLRVSTHADYRNLMLYQVRQKPQQLVRLS